ncbi:potassium channel family protein [Paraliomyxa miuraensis]|uniref:potassium channel family protein n=1 Tax=Paraliomyxa miuraensis TaxID=376150 RepID=UPI00224FF728|nr:NAD-binding protein [Paraliomyxa miuraensis]MCX4243440.1 NAD-binding protein [Paraliomyxa miuraensis]
MSTSLRRVLLLVAALPGVLVLLACLYMLGMEHLEHSPRTFAASFVWAAETLTSTGYGGDSHWHHPAMITLVVMVQFLGMSMAFLVFPLLVMPYFEQRFEGRLPRAAPAKLRDYVLVYRWSPAVESLLDELQRAKVPAVVHEEDEPLARRLRERGRTVVYGNLEDDDLDPALLARARAIIANGSDPANGALVLLARQRGFSGEIIALVDEPLHRRPMMLQGATAVYTPRHVQAAALAGLAHGRVASRLTGIQHLGGKLKTGELRVHRDSALAGQTIAEADIRRRTGATIIGQWRGGEFNARVPGSTVIEPGAILVAVGSEEALGRLGELAKPLSVQGPFVVLGYGEVGRKVVEFLRDAGEPTVVIDREPGDGVDVVGDALDPAVLREAGVTKARAAILSVADDSTNLFTTAVVRDLAPEIPIIARVARVDHVERFHRAGADFALSLGEVAGEILAHKLLGDEWISLETRLKLVGVEPAGLAGRKLRESSVGAKTGCSVVAVERDEEVIVDVSEDFVPKAGDRVYLCGTEDALERYFERFPGARPG